MTRYMKPMALGLLTLVLASTPLISQSSKLRVNFDEEGKTYFKAAIRTQFWLRYTDLNPGSQINGEDLDQKTDVSIRRLRITAAAQLTERFYFYSLWGFNNLNHISNRDIFIHPLDLYGEYELWKKHLFVGAGKNAWQGLSRWHIRSTKSYMAIDAPLYPLATVNKTDDIGRNLGMWLKGQFGRLDYRLSFAQPTIFLTSTPGVDADFAVNRPRWNRSAYVKYQLFDMESNKSPYHANTYLGTKKVLALGAGFMYQPRASWTQPTLTADTAYHAINHWSVDAFLDLPLNKATGTAITSYLGYLSTDFGPNFVRNLGANNPVNGSNPSELVFNGRGNALPMMGTGTTIFWTFGYLLPKNFIVREQQQLQPNIAIQFSEFEKLNDPMILLDIGVNWLIKGHSNKLSLGYQNRPLFDNNLDAYTRKGMVVMQYQIEIN